MPRLADPQAPETVKQIDIWKWGEPTVGFATKRPDGRVVKVPILDPRDPGLADPNTPKTRERRAKEGSAALLAAIRKVRPE